jgi:hypothetical protein
MATYKITYKNHCTPQEYVTENSRWYLDSDVGARLTGIYSHITSTQPVYTSNLAVTATPSADLAPADCTYIYVKNTDTAGTGGDCVLSFAGANTDADAYRVKLAPGECFTSMVDTLFKCYVKRDASIDTTIEYLTAIG